MKLNRRDYFTLGALGLLLAALAAGTGKGKGRNLPLDDRHRPSYDALNSGRGRAEVELVCTTYHSKSTIPLPKDHPPKEQCLICHKQVTA